MTSSARVAAIAGGLALATVAAACTERGTVSVDLGPLPAACELPAPTQVQVYLVRGATCDCVTAAAPCTACATVCAAGACTAGCDGVACPIEDLDGGLVATPPGPGQYAAIYQFLVDGLVVATACAVIEVEADGTGSSTVTADARCCSAGA